jgi:hypothetical protein
VTDVIEGGTVALMLTNCIELRNAYHECFLAHAEDPKACPMSKCNEIKEAADKVCGAAGGTGDAFQ